MGMLTPDEGEGYQQLGENLCPQGAGDKGLVGDFLTGGGSTGGSSGISDSLAYHQACKGTASSLLPGVDLSFGELDMDLASLGSDSTSMLTDTSGATSHSLVSADGATGLTGAESFSGGPAEVLGAGPAGGLSVTGTEAMLPGADAMLPGGGGPAAGLESLGGTISKMMGDMLGAGTPMGFLGQLMEFLMNLFSPEALSEIGNIAAQAAEASAAEIGKIKAT